MTNVFFELQKTGLAALDLTPFMDVQNYNVNADPVFQEWTDANYTYHREYFRTRVNGDFSVGFETETERDAFISAVGQYRTAGAYTVQALVHNEGSADTVETFPAYLTITGAGKFDLINGRQWLTYTVKVEGV